MFGANLIPTGIPSKGETIFSVKSSVLKQLCCGTQQLWEVTLVWGGPGTRWPAASGPSLTKLLCSDALNSALLHSSETSSMFWLQPGKFSLRWKGKVSSLSQRRACLWREKSLTLVLGGPILNLINPKSTILIDEDGAAWIGHERY